MKSPFPGMDPYLEPHWLDVHTSLVTESRNALNSKLPEDLIARAEERIAIEADGEFSHGLSPDVRIFQGVGVAAPDSSSGNGGVVLAPYRLVALTEPATERFIEIVEVNGDRLVSVIEFVSPTNKRGSGLESFVAKREELLSGGVNVVEIDLVRAGNWEELMLPHRCPDKALSTYRATIRVPGERSVAYLQPMSLRAALPAIRIPLRSRETPVELALQPLLDEAYHNGRYWRTLRYDQPLNPPLGIEDDQWMDQLLRAAGRRV